MTTGYVYLRSLCPGLLLALGCAASAAEEPTKRFEHLRQDWEQVGQQIVATVLQVQQLESELDTLEGDAREFTAWRQRFYGRMAGAAQDLWTTSQVPTLNHEISTWLRRGNAERATPLLAQLDEAVNKAEAELASLEDKHYRQPLIAEFAPRIDRGDTKLREMLKANEPELYAAALKQRREPLAALDAAAPITNDVLDQLRIYANWTGTQDESYQRWTSKIEEVGKLKQELAKINRINVDELSAKEKIAYRQQLDQLMVLVGNEDADVAAWSQKLPVTEDTIAALRTKLTHLDQVTKPSDDAASTLQSLSDIVGKSDEDVIRWRQKLDSVQATTAALQPFADLDYLKRGQWPQAQQAIAAHEQLVGDTRLAATVKQLISDSQAALAQLEEQLAVLDRAETPPDGTADALKQYESYVDAKDKRLLASRAKLQQIKTLKTQLSEMNLGPNRVLSPQEESQAMQAIGELEKLVGRKDADIQRWLPFVRVPIDIEVERDLQAAGNDIAAIGTALAKLPADFDYTTSDPIRQARAKQLAHEISTAISGKQPGPTPTPTRIDNDKSNHNSSLEYQLADGTQRVLGPVAWTKDGISINNKSAIASLKQMWNTQIAGPHNDKVNAWNALVTQLQPQVQALQALDAEQQHRAVIAPLTQVQLAGTL